MTTVGPHAGCTRQRGRCISPTDLPLDPGGAPCVQTPLASSTASAIFIPFVPSLHAAAFATILHESVLIIATACQRIVAGAD